MPLQACINNIKAQTGKSPENFKQLAEQKGFMKDGRLVKTIKAIEITNWLKGEFLLGHGIPWQYMLPSKEKQNKYIRCLLFKVL